MTKLRVVHYLNQFFAGLGGEERANEGPRVWEGPLGPGQFLERALGDAGEIVATVACGDNAVNENGEATVAQVVALIGRRRPDLVVAGPAFNAGRYGLACGQVCGVVQGRLNVATVTGMYPENPAVDLYRTRVHIVATGATAAAMGVALERMASLGRKLARGERVGLPGEEGYIPRGLRFTDFVAQPAAVRAAEMLAKRLRGEPCETEWPLPQIDRVPPPPAIKDLKKATVALVTTAGVVPKGNPDRLEATFATKWLKYSLVGLPDLVGHEWQSVHGGYNGTFVDEDPDRVIPVDVLRDLEDECVVGRLFNYYYVTVGSGASIASARKFAQDIARDLVESAVDGVILTAT